MFLLAWLACQSVLKAQARRNPRPSDAPIMALNRPSMFSQSQPQAISWLESQSFQLSTVSCNQICPRKRCECSSGSSDRSEASVTALKSGRFMGPDMRGCSSHHSFLQGLRKFRQAFTNSPRYLANTKETTSHSSCRAKVLRGPEVASS